MERTHGLYIFKPEINAGKMIFLFGPRQVGKTTFVKNRLKKNGTEFLYFNWDDPYVKREYVKNPHFLKSYLAKTQNVYPMVVFDEIHKHKNWKNILKGIYDIHKDEAQIVVTGSARLDYFRQSGDSLVGRYFSYRMLPIGLSEASDDFTYIQNEDAVFLEPEKNKLPEKLNSIEEKVFKDSYERLLNFGGFPEPYLKANKNFSVKWKNDYKSLLVREDLRDLTKIQDIKGIEQLLLLLSERVSLPLSVNSLREDLQVNHRTITNWIEALKKVYLVFSLMPWSNKISKAIKKENKVYFFDWSMVDEAGARLENLVAVSLLRMISRFNELGLGNYDLRYVRNQQGHEVDFMVIKDNKPFALFEAKLSDGRVSKSGLYFNKIFNIPYYQLVGNCDKTEVYPNNIYIVPAWRFLALLG